MIAGVVVCGNTGSAKAALCKSEGNVAAFSTTGTEVTAETVCSGTGSSKTGGSTTGGSKPIDSMGSSVNVVAAGDATSPSRGISKGSSGNEAVSVAPSSISFASYVGRVISSTLSGISADGCGVIAVTSVNSPIAETSAIAAVCGVS